MSFCLEKIKEVYKGRSPRPVGEQREFALLIPLVEIDGETYLIYEVRAKHMQTQPGEICFPGGRIEKGETVKEAALRETHEELGIKIENIDVIGPGDFLRTHAGLILYTFLGQVALEDYENRKLNPPEVDETFLVPLSWLLENPPTIFKTEVYPRIDEDFPYDRFGVTSDYPWRKGEYTIPLYEYPDGDLVRPIWGLTAMLTMYMVETIRDGGGDHACRGKTKL